MTGLGSWDTLSSHAFCATRPGIRLSNIFGVRDLACFDYQVATVGMCFKRSVGSRNYERFVERLMRSENVKFE